MKNPIPEKAVPIVKVGAVVFYFDENIDMEKSFLWVG